MQIYAHRGARGLAPENTLYACEIAVKHQVDFIDLDIGMTRDGKLVATHDIFLNPDITRDARGRFIEKKIPIYSLTYEELSPFNVGQINPSSKYATYFPDQHKLAEAKIPLLEEAIDYILSTANHPICFQFEIKTHPENRHLTAPPEKFAEELANLILKKKIAEKTEVQSFDFYALLALNKYSPGIKTTFLTLSCKGRKEEVWFAGHTLKSYEGSLLKMIYSLGGKCWGPFQGNVTKNQVEEAKKLGLKVVPWGYPEKEGCEFNFPQIVKLIEWGVDGIITDRPDSLKQLLLRL